MTPLCQVFWKFRKVSDVQNLAEEDAWALHRFTRVSAPLQKFEKALLWSLDLGSEWLGALWHRNALALVSNIINLHQASSDLPSRPIWCLQLFTWNFIFQLAAFWNKFLKNTNDFFGWISALPGALWWLTVTLSSTACFKKRHIFWCYPVTAKNHAELHKKSRPVDFCSLGPQCATSGFEWVIISPVVLGYPWNYLDLDLYHTGMCPGCNWTKRRRRAWPGSVRPAAASTAPVRPVRSVRPVRCMQCHNACLLCLICTKTLGCCMALAVREAAWALASPAPGPSSESRRPPLVVLRRPVSRGAQRQARIMDAGLATPCPSGLQAQAVPTRPLHAGGRHTADLCQRPCRSAPRWRLTRSELLLVFRDYC